MSLSQGGKVTSVDPSTLTFVTDFARHKAAVANVIPRIAGRKSADIATAMREYRSGAWPSSVMGRIAKGFDDSQIDAIAAWFAAQPE